MYTFLLWFNIIIFNDNYFCFVFAVTAFSAQWTDGSFTTMQLSWEPVTVADGVAAVYTVSYSPVVNASGGAIDSAGTMQKQTTSSTVTVSGLNPTTWYYFRVEIEENVAAGGSSSTDSGVGIGGPAYSALTFTLDLISP